MTPRDSSQTKHRKYQRRVNDIKRFGATFENCVWIKLNNSVNINLNAIDTYGQTGYHYACKSDKKENFEVFKKILDHAETYNIGKSNY